MEIKMDLYKELQIDRSWDEKTIRNHLKSLQKLWTQRQGACNDKEQLMQIEKVLDAIEDAYRLLTKETKRKQYDAALDAAYKNGSIVDHVEEKLNTILEQAKAYYQKGNIKLATKLAEEAVEGRVNDPSAYDLLARCYYDQDKHDEALAVIDQGIEVFKDDIGLHWLGSRIATHGAQNYADAQRRINVILELAPESPIGHSEQIYLHLRKGEEQLAFQEIDTYISAHPDDARFKQGVAYDLDAYSNTCYYHDTTDDTYFIADADSYKKCLSLRKKAVEIHSDEYTRKQLEDAQYYGQRKWNDWNTESVKTLGIYGALLSVLYWPVGLILLALDVVLIYFSFVPYWQINKAYVTGNMGPLVETINVIGKLAAKFAVWFFRFIIEVYKLIFRLIWALVKGIF